MLIVGHSVTLNGEAQCDYYFELWCTMLQFDMLNFEMSNNHLNTYFCARILGCPLRF